jgi:hypothetical protein
MEVKTRKRWNWVLMILAGGVLLLCVGSLMISALINFTSPTESKIQERLSSAEKARLAEAIHLRQTLGDQVWPGWAEQEIPFIVYNEAYAFLVGFPGQPADGWVMVPREEKRGSAWEVVPDDDFFGQPYYRQQIVAEDKTPENFTVKVGEVWVATFMTKEYGEIAFRKGFGEQLPPVIRDMFPYQLIWAPLGGESGSYINGLEHESFHSFQGMNNYAAFAQAEDTGVLEERYPWEDEALEAAWKAELEVLSQARDVSSPEDAGELAARFIKLRAERRSAAALGGQMVEYEKRQEWLEGLAKYAELSLAYAAASTQGYEPLPVMEDDPDFKGYARQANLYKQQFSEVARMSGRGGSTRFYYGGFAQAVLLDHLLPGWKERALQGEFLEDLLREAIGS